MTLNTTLLRIKHYCTKGEKNEYDSFSLSRSLSSISRSLSRSLPTATTGNQRLPQSLEYCARRSRRFRSDVKVLPLLALPRRQLDPEPHREVLQVVVDPRGERILLQIDELEHRRVPQHIQVDLQYRIIIG